MGNAIFLSKNAKKRSGKINVSLELDDAFILLRFLDQNKHRTADGDMGSRLEKIVEDLSSDLHSDIFIKTKALLYNNHYNFIKQNIDDKIIREMENNIDSIIDNFHAERSKLDALEALEIVDSFLKEIPDNGFLEVETRHIEKLQEQNLMIEKLREISRFLGTPM